MNPNEKANKPAAAPPLFTEVPVAKIRPDPKNRKEYDKAKLQSLADTIAAEGLLEPIIVRWSPHPATNTDYLIVAGERRWRAVGLLKQPTILARVLPQAGPNDNAPADAGRTRLVENKQREDLTPIEEARQFRELTVDHKMTQAEVAGLAGCSQPAVANALRLLELPGPVQQMIQEGGLTRAHGVTLARFARWPKICEIMARHAVKNGTASKDLERDSLPCEYELNRAGLVVEIPTADYCSVRYAVPEALQKDPSFIQQKWDRCWLCLEPEKWAPEKARQDKAREAKAATEKQKSEAGRKAGKITHELAERRKKITENKENRAAVEERMTAAEMRLAKVRDYDPAAIRVIVHEALANYRGPDDSQFSAAAAAVGVSVPRRLNADDPRGLEALKPSDLIRVAAAAIARAHAEEALRYAGEVPDVLAHLAGETRKPAGHGAVTVMSNGNDNRARAGSAQASCTSGPMEAARRAAAKHFGCKEDLVKLACTRPGNTGGLAFVYAATRKPAAEKTKKGRAS